jgi:5-methylcytosine-specific restriction endonuclease McrA
MKASLEARVWRRANGLCEYCRISQEFDELTFEIDHIIAQKHRSHDVNESGTRLFFVQQIQVKRPERH